MALFNKDIHPIPSKPSGTRAADTATGTEKPPASDKPEAASAPESRLTVGPNIKLRGVEIEDCDTLVVEGYVEAAMDSRVIEIAETGVYKGKVDIDIAVVRGRFEGELTARERLVVDATGDVSGTIRYGRLAIEEGGRVHGDLDELEHRQSTGTVMTPNRQDNDKPSKKASDAGSPDAA